MNPETHQWELLSDSLEQPETRMPEILQTLIGYVRTIGSFHGSNTEFTEGFCSFCHVDVSAKAIKQLMNRFRIPMEEIGVLFESHRSNGQRFLHVWYAPPAEPARDESDASDVSNTVCEICVPCVPVS